MQAVLRFLALLLPDQESLPKVFMYALLLPLAFLSFFAVSPTVILESIPLAAPSQVNWYIEASEEVSEKYGKGIDWQELLAIDAVRLEQDFSKSSLEKVKNLAEMFIWEEVIEHESCSINDEGNESCTSWTEIIYHKYSLPELLEILNLEDWQKNKVYIFLETDLTILKDVGNEMPAGWKPNIGELEWPVPGVYRITSKFGPRVDPVEFLDGFHTGLDIGVSKNTSVVAVEEGKVIFAGFAGNYGYVIFIKHEKYITRYCHLSKIYVKEKDEVFRGEIIGLVGSTGKSTGPHLHFEVRRGSKALDPLQFYKEGLNVYVYSY